MKFFVTQMFENRAYRAYSKARSRLAPRFDDLKEIFQPMKLDGEKFDDIIVTFVDAPEDHYREIKNRDRVYDVEVAVPDMSYKSAEDEALLLKIAEKLREVLERAPLKEATRTELLQQFSNWESSMRQRSVRSV